MNRTGKCTDLYSNMICTAANNPIPAWKTNETPSQVPKTCFKKIRVLSNPKTKPIVFAVIIKKILHNAPKDDKCLYQGRLPYCEFQHHMQSISAIPRSLSVVQRACSDVDVPFVLVLLLRLTFQGEQIA